MIRLYNLYLPSRLFTFIAIDGLILLAVAAVTMHPADVFHLHFSAWRPLLLPGLMSVVFLWCLYLFDLYELDLKPTWQDVFVRSLRALGVAMILLIPVWWLAVPMESRKSPAVAFLWAYCLR